MGVVFSGEEGLRHCKMCDSPELFPGEINPYGYCFGCSDGDEELGKPEPVDLNRWLAAGAPSDEIRG